MADYRALSIQLDEEDIERVGSRSLWLESGRVRLKIDGKSRDLARWLLDAPAGLEVDHRDRNTLNNRRSNLRLATKSQNLCNRRGWSKKTEFKGIKFKPHRPGKQRARWEVWIVINGRRTYVGSSPDPMLAARMYDKAATEHYGEFAMLNFPEA